MEKLGSKRWRGWKQILRIDNEAGASLVFVVMFMPILLLFMAMIIDLGGLLVQQEQVTNLADLAAAAGGRVAAEAIAYAAGLRHPNPTEAEKAEAVKFISPQDREEIQNGTYQLAGVAIKEVVSSEITKYALLNAPLPINFSSDNDLIINYMPDFNDCLNEFDKTAEIEAGAKAKFTFLFGGLLKIFGLEQEKMVAATGTYQLQICP